MKSARWLNRVPLVRWVYRRGWKDAMNQENPPKRRDE